MKTVEQKKAEQRERSVQHSMQSCRHFNGVGNGKCEAGINYDDVQPLPCIPVSATTQTAQCALKSCLTREEAEAERDRRDRRAEEGFKAMTVAHNDAHEKGYIKGHGGQSSVACPICEGTIRYSVASVNGHMMAGCTTKGCVSWME